MKDETQRAIFRYGDRAYGADDVVRALRAVGVRDGSVLFAHSNLRSFGKLVPGVTRTEYLETFIQALRASIGAFGTLIMPTFSYSFCRHEEFDPATTPSTVGTVTEHFRTLRGVVRSVDPIFSVAALGAEQAFFVDVGTNCFGGRSVFEKLYERDAMLVFLGETFDITYIHFVEQACGVRYRSLKRFSGQIAINGELKECTVDYNVRPLDLDVEYDLKEIMASFERCGILRSASLGWSHIRAVGARDAFRVIAEGLQGDPYFLLREPPAHARHLGVYAS